MIEIDGWYVTKTRGPCRQYTHDSKRGLLTVAGTPGEVFGHYTLKSIFSQTASDEVFNSYRKDSNRIFSIFS